MKSDGTELVKNIYLHQSTEVHLAGQSNWPRRRWRVVFAMAHSYVYKGYNAE